MKKRKKVEAVKLTREEKIAARKIRAAKKRTAAKHASYIAMYNKHVESLADTLLQVVLRAYGSFEAVSRVNEHLRKKFNLGEDDGLDVRLVEQTLRHASKLEVTRAILKHSKISPRDREEIAQRIIAQLLPTKDGLPINQAGPSVGKIKSSLERIVRDEAARTRAESEKLIASREIGQRNETRIKDRNVKVR